MDPIEFNFKRVVALPAGVTRKSVVQKRADALLALLNKHPDGLTMDECCDALDIDESQFRGAVRELRLQLGDTDAFNVVVNASDGWRYKLVGQFDQAEEWFEMRFKTLISNLETAHAVSTSMLASPAGRKNVREKAEKAERVIGYLLKELESIDGYGR